MNVQLLAEQHFEFLSLKEGCTECSESTLIKMPYCWKSHVTAHITMFSTPFSSYNEALIKLSNKNDFKSLLIISQEVQQYLLHNL